MKVKIVPLDNKKATRIAHFDGRFEIGKDNTGRWCRVADHKMDVKKTLATLGKFTTGGNTYSEAKEGEE